MLSLPKGLVGLLVGAADAVGRGGQCLVLGNSFATASVTADPAQPQDSTGRVDLPATTPGSTQRHERLGSRASVSPSKASISTDSLREAGSKKGWGKGKGRGAVRWPSGKAETTPQLPDESMLKDVLCLLCP